MLFMLHYLFSQYHFGQFCVIVAHITLFRIFDTAGRIDVNALKSQSDPL